MEFIEVFYDNEKGLTLDEVYYENDRKIVTNTLSGDVVKLYLGVLVNKNIQSRRYINNCECIFYNDICIKIYNYKFIREHGLLTGYLNKVDNQVRVKKDKLSSKVKRKNKYTGRKIIIGGLAFLMLLCAANVVANSKSDTVDVKNNYGYSQIIATKPIESDLNDIVKPSEEKENFKEETLLDEKETEGPVVFEDEIIEDTKNYIYVDYEDRSNDDKINTTKKLYGKIIEKYARMYGLDSRLVIALATQERGIHSSVMDRGGATGLMQIQNSVWVGNSITAYNFETGKKETCTISKSSLADCETNIKIGCMILQDCMRRNNYNILLGLQSYNMGTRGVGYAVSAYAQEIDCSRDEVVNNPSYCGWMNYREGINGDPLYVEHVLSYIGSDISICIYKNDGTMIECFVKNYENTKFR